MALSIGELVGYVDLDTGAAEGALDKMGGLLDGAGSKWSLALGGAGVAAGGAFAASLVGAMNLEPGRDKIAAALDLNEKQAARSGKVAGSVYADGWGESADEVNNAVESVMSSIKGMRKASEKDLQATTEAAIVFADSMGVDVTKAAQVAGNMVHNGLAKNGLQAFNLLQEAGSRVPKELRGDILDATDEYGQFFHTLGITGPQAMNLLAKGAGKGMYGIDKAGDAIKEFTIRATDGSDLTQQAMQSIGLDANKMSEQLLKGGPKARKAFNQIVGGLLKIKDPAKRAQASLKLFGTPMEDLGVKDIPKFLKSLKTGGKGLDDFKGATKRAGDTMSDNAANNIETFKRKLQTGFVSMIGGRVLPKLTDLTGALNKDLGPALHAVGDVLGKVTGFLEKHHTTAAILVGVIGTLVGVTALYEATMAVSAAGGMAAWLKGTKLITGVTKVQTAVQWALNAAMSANPVMLVVIALAALGVALYIAWRKSSTFREVVTGALHAVQKVASKVFGWLRGAVTGVIDFVRSHWKLILAILTGPVGLAVLFITKNFGKIRSVASDVVGWIAGIPGKLGSLAGRFGTAGKNLLQGFINGMKNAAGIIKGIAGNVWDTVQGLLNGAIDKINAALEFNISIGFGKHISVNPPDIPHLRTGGRTGANSPGMAWIGDANEPESVLRDSQLVALMKHAAAAAVAAASGRGRDYDGPPIAVYAAPDESAEVTAERTWYLLHTRG